MAHCWTGRDCPTNLSSGKDYSVCGSCEHPDCSVTQAAREYWGEPSGAGTCMLELGHEGPHEWTSDSDIVVTFPVV